MRFVKARRSGHLHSLCSCNERTEMDFETLERRRLLSVSVVEGYPGYYEVYGDDAPNVISVAFSAADGTFTVNGATYGGVS